MATGNEILSYTPNPDLAFGSTALPAASTDAIVDTSPAIKYWEQYAQNKLAVAKDLNDQVKKKQLQAQADIEDALKAGQYVGWDKSNEWLIPKYDEFRKMVVDVAKKGNWDNYNDPDFQKAQQLQGELLQGVKYSMQQKENWKVLNDEVAKNGEKYHTDSQKSIDEYANTSNPFDRAKMDINLVPRFDADAIGYINKIKTAVQPTQVVTSEKDKYGRYIDTTETFYPAEDILSTTQTQYSTDKKFQSGWDEAFKSLPPTEQSKYGDAPHYASAVAFDALNGGNKQATKNPFYPPGSGEVAKIPDFDYQTDLTMNVATPKGTVHKVADRDSKGKFIEKNGERTYHWTVVGDNGKPIEGGESFGTLEEAGKFRNSAGGTVTIPARGWVVSGIADFPSNINAGSFRKVWDFTGNVLTDKEKLTTSLTQIDGGLIIDGAENNDTGAFLEWDKYEKMKPENKKKYTPIRTFQLKTAAGNTISVPYDKTISIPIRNALKSKKVPDSKLPENVPIGGGFDLNQTSQPAAQDRSSKAKALLESQGLDSSPSSIATFLKNNPNFK